VCVVLRAQAGIPLLPSHPEPRAACATLAAGRVCITSQCCGRHGCISSGPACRASYRHQPSPLARPSWTALHVTHRARLAPPQQRRRGLHAPAYSHASTQLAPRHVHSLVTPLLRHKCSPAAPCRGKGHHDAHVYTTPSIKPALATCAAHITRHCCPSPSCPPLCLCVTPCAEPGGW
jgi:hypothetical protein